MLEISNCYNWRVCARSAAKIIWSCREVRRAYYLPIISRRCTSSSSKAQVVLSAPPTFFWTAFLIAAELPLSSNSNGADSSDPRLRCCCFWNKINTCWISNTRMMHKDRRIVSFHFQSIWKSTYFSEEFRANHVRMRICVSQYALVLEWYWKTQPTVTKLLETESLTRLFNRSVNFYD